MQLFVIMFRTIFLYILIMLSYRVMGKREIGQLSIMDLTISILMAELVALSIEKTSDSIFISIVPIIILVVIEIVLAYISMKSRSFRTFIEGKSSMIICDGKLNYHEMINQRYNLDDLLLNLRQQKIKSIEEVEYAFLESNGKLSIFPYDNNKPKKIYPVPLIIDGEINKENLKKTKYTITKIYSLLYENNIQLSNVFYGFLNNDKIFIILKDKNKSFLDNKNLLLKRK